MNPGVERLELLRRIAGRARTRNLGVAPPFSVGDYVWVRFGRTQGILLARVLSPHPVAMQAIDFVRDWWSVAVFVISAESWDERPRFRRVLRKLTDGELRDLRAERVIP